MVNDHDYTAAATPLDIESLLLRYQKKVEDKISAAGGSAELPFIPETDPCIGTILSDAIVAVECENSLWRGVKMPDFLTPLRPQERLGGKPGLRKGAVLPNIIIKEEDRQPLKDWQRLRNVPIHVWHVFYDRAYGLSLDRAEVLIEENLTEATVQTFQASGGATTKKAIYKHYYHYGYPLGISTEDPKLLPAFVEDKNGHILPYVTFSGGHLSLLPESLEQLHLLAARRK